MFVLLALCLLGMMLLSTALLVLWLRRIFGRGEAKLRPRARRIILAVYAAYLSFVCLGTGPTSSDDYPPAHGSAYRAPWPPDATSCVAQGHRSIVSHRGDHLHAWDFVRPLGSPILAARGGRVRTVADARSGVGWFEGNHIVVEHDDGSASFYAHMARDSARVRVGQMVHQGQHLADVGMVGKTLFPHLHFVVLGPRGRSQPVQFADVGLPRAGRCYRAAP